MDMTNKDSLRIAVRALLGKSHFSLSKARDKSDEFKTSDGQTIYFYWKQGGGINIAIDPRIPFDALLSIPGVEFKNTGNPKGLRFGTSMTAFPGDFEGTGPESRLSKVGRVFGIEVASFQIFMNTLIEILSGKSRQKHESANVQPEAASVDENLNSPVFPGDSSTENYEPDKSGSQGFEQDPEMRSVVELYAESVATRYYKSEGYQVEKFGKPFDLLCTKDGESIHVEVKGSRSKLDTVFLTINEVSDAENAAWQSDLFIVDQIVVEKIGSDLVPAAGVARVIQNWVPAKEMLAPSEFRYRLPDQSQWSFFK